MPPGYSPPMLNLNYCFSNDDGQLSPELVGGSHDFYASCQPDSDSDGCENGLHSASRKDYVDLDSDLYTTDGKPMSAPMGCKCRKYESLDFKLTSIDLSMYPVTVHLEH